LVRLISGDLSVSSNSRVFVADGQVLVAWRKKKPAHFRAPAINCPSSYTDRLIDDYRGLGALVRSILAGSLQIFGDGVLVHLNMSLVVGPHLKNLGRHVRTNPATNAQVRVDSRFHRLILL